MQTVVVTFDRLPAHSLGCYGNELIETPAFDRLAATADVFDQHYVEIPGPAGPLHPWWTGRFEFFSSRATGPLIAERLQQAGVFCRLITDRQHGLPSGGFDEVEIIDGESGIDADHAQTAFARLVTRAQEWLTEDSTPQGLLWLHSRGVPSPWLPPRVFAELYLNELNEDDDDPAESGQASAIIDSVIGDEALFQLLLCDLADDESDDNDEPAGPVMDETAQQISRYVFLGYVTLIDHWLGRLLKTIDEVDSETLLLVSAAAGHSFGERMTFLPANLQDSVHSQLTDSSLQTPLLLRDSRRNGYGRRRNLLAQPPDLAATILDSLAGLAGDELDGISLLKDDEVDRNRKTAWHFSASGECGIRNREWLCVARDAESVVAAAEDRQDQVDEMDSFGRLYAKPDDAWELNDVSEQHPEEMLCLMRELRDRLPACRTDHLPRGEKPIQQESAGG